MHTRYAGRWKAGPYSKVYYNRLGNTVNLYEKVPGGSYKAPVSVHGITDPVVKQALSESSYREIIEEIELLDNAHGGFERSEVLSGKTTPVFFGSAANNFGVELFLDWFLDHSVHPMPRKAGDSAVPLEGPVFSAFIFKIQTNMNPQHRDRMVFARVCSGKFTRDMTAYNTRNGKEVRISNSHSIFGREREISNEAYPGDIIGFITNSDFRIGDTISSDPSLCFNEIPRFAPECFAYIQNTSISSYKSFRKGLEHLLAEDIVQSFYPKDSGRNLPLLGAVGPLQFDVLQYRLRDEYGVETNLDMKQWSRTALAGYYCRRNIFLKCIFLLILTMGRTKGGDRLYFFKEIWTMQYFREKNPDICLYDTPVQ